VTFFYFILTRLNVLMAVRVPIVPRIPVHLFLPSFKNIQDSFKNIEDSFKNIQDSFD
jgi:hypothetical protein